MKSNQLIEIENVKNANRVLKNLLERSRTEVVGMGLFYGRAGHGKSRWGIKTAQMNGYVYMRLEANMSVKDFLVGLLGRLLSKTMPHFEVKGTINCIYNQVLDFLHSEMDTVVVVDEINYAFHNKKILETIRDLSDESLATFIMIGMEDAKEKMIQMSSHFFDRCNSFYLFQSLNLSDTELILNEICDVKIDEQLVKYIHKQSNGKMRIINKYIDALERIGKRMNKNELTYDEIKDLITKVEA